MNIAIIGSRSISITPETMWKYINDRIDCSTIDSIVSGGAKGIDSTANELAKEHNIKTLIFRPRYDLYPYRQAPLMRNISIVENSDILFAFWDGKSKGTEFTINKARKKGIKTHVIYI